MHLPNLRGRCHEDIEARQLERLREFGDRKKAQEAEEGRMSSRCAAAVQPDDIDGPSLGWAKSGAVATKEAE